MKINYQKGATVGTQQTGLSQKSECAQHQKDVDNQYGEPSRLWIPERLGLNRCVRYLGHSDQEFGFNENRRVNSKFGGRTRLSSLLYHVELAFLI